MSKQRIKLLKREDVIFLWYVDYYDGPLSGICLYEGKLYYFSLEKEKFSSRDRTEIEIQQIKDELKEDYDPIDDDKIFICKDVYYLYELTDKEYHILFSNYSVVTHCCSLNSSYLVGDTPISHRHESNEELEKIKKEVEKFKPKLIKEKVRYAIYLKSCMYS